MLEQKKRERRKNMKKRYTEPEWMQIALSAQDVIACSDGESGGNLNYSEDDSKDKDSNKVSW